MLTTVDEDLVFQEPKDGLRAFDRAGQVRWERAIPFGRILAVLPSSGDLIVTWGWTPDEYWDANEFFVGSSGVARLRGRTGEILWAKHTPPGRVVVDVDRNRLYYAMGIRNVVSFEASESRDAAEVDLETGQATRCAVGALVLRNERHDPPGPIPYDLFNGALPSFNYLARGRVVQVSAQWRQPTVIFDPETWRVVRRTYDRTRGLTDGLVLPDVFEAPTFLWDDGSVVSSTHEAIERLDLETADVVDSWDMDVLMPDGYAQVPFSGQWVVAHDGGLYSATAHDGGGLAVLDLFGRNRVLRKPDMGLYFTQPMVAQDGTIMYWDGTGFVTWFAPANRPLWRLRPVKEVSASLQWWSSAVLLSDGTLVYSDTEGVVSWWQTKHGGLAHTPLPIRGFDNQGTNRMREPPFPDAPEIDNPF